MDILKRNITFGTQKSFTTATMQAFIDGLNAGDRAAGRRLDEIESKSEFKSMVIRTQYSDNVWSIPQIWINDGGVVSNEDIKGMVIENNVPMNIFWDPTWVTTGGAVIASIIAKAKCIIPSFLSGSSDQDGVLVLAVADAYGDAVAANITITLRVIDAGEPINAIADSDSKTLLPDGTPFYTHWYIDVPLGINITPQAIYTALTGSSFNTFFDIFYIAYSAVTYLDTSTTEQNFSFIKHPLSLQLPEATVDALYTALTHVFDDEFNPDDPARPEQAGYTRSVSIVLPNAEESDGEITDISRYLQGNGSINVTTGMIKKEDELSGIYAGKASGYKNIITFAHRADANTVIFCDGTKIYKDRLAPNFFFKSESTSIKRELYLTGSSYGVYSPSVLVYDEGSSKAELAVWSSLGYGYYTAPTRLHGSASASLVNTYLRRTDTEATTHFAHQVTTSNTKPIFSIDRFKGYVCVGGGKRVGTAMPTTWFTPPRNFDNEDVGTALPAAVYPWNHSMLSIVAPDPSIGGTKAGILFSRAFTASNLEDNKHSSYLFQSFRTDNTATENQADREFNGLYLVTQSRQIVLAASPESYKSTPTSSLDSYGAWRSRVTIGGGDPRDSKYSVAGQIKNRVWTGDDFTDGVAKPQCYETIYGNKISRDAVGEVDGTSGTITDSEELLSFTRIFTAGSGTSEAFDVPNADHMNIMAWTKLGKPEESVMKFVHKYGAEGPASDTGYPSRDLPGETGLRVGHRAFVGGSSNKYPCSELVSFSTYNTGGFYGQSKFIPKVMTAVVEPATGGAFNSSVVFCGLTTATSTEECALLGQGLTVMADAIGGGLCILKHDLNLKLFCDPFILDITPTYLSLYSDDHSGSYFKLSPNTGTPALLDIIANVTGDILFTAGEGVSLTSGTQLYATAPIIQIESANTINLDVTDSYSGGALNFKGHMDSGDLLSNINLLLVTSGGISRVFTLKQIVADGETFWAFQV